MTSASPSAAGEARSVPSIEVAAAVVFDADGVLVDTEPAWAAARRALFNEHGRQFGEAEQRQTLGTGIAGTAETLAARLGEPDQAGELDRELLSLLIAEISEDPPRSLPGAIELLEQLRGELPMAVASNSPGVLLERSLQAAGLDGFFDAVLGVDEVAHAKPAPDLYLAAVKRLDAEPTRSVAVEDSPTGVASARSAGLYVIAVQPLAHVSLDGDLVVESLGDSRFRARLGAAARRAE